jgi:ubiquinone/menaquinone biosynthesis C-methylase UbiE
MNVQKDEKILDMGCGQGVFSRLLARAGASVTGVDLSSSLIDAARQRGGGIRYFCNDAVHFTLPREEFDASSFILSIMNMDPLDDTLHHQSKLIRKGGRLLLVLIHPCFRIPRQSSWGFDENKKIQFRRVDRYATSMAIPIQMFPGSRPSETTPTFHRSLQTYSQALAKHGFSITAIEEWTSHRKSEPGPRARAENRAREEFPLFLALLARKDD